MKRLSAKPHHVGSEAGRENAEFMAAQFRNWGYETKIEKFYVLFPTPQIRLLEMTGPKKFRATLREPALKEDTTSAVAGQLPIYNAYSVDGDVTAPLVYVNYGIPSDYETLEAKGIKPVTEEKFNIGDTDMTSQLLRAKAANADVILTYGIGPELAQIANGMGKLGWKLPLIGSWTLSMSTFIDNAGANGEGAVMPQTFIQAPSTPKRKAFIEAYQAAYKVDRIPSPISAAQGYDGTYLLAAAINQAKSTEGPKIKAALENLSTKVEGVVTVYDRPFTATDHESITANIPVFGLVKGGRVVAEREDDIAGANAVRVKTR